MSYEIDLLYKHFSKEKVTYISITMPINQNKKTRRKDRIYDLYRVLLGLLGEL